MVLQLVGATFVLIRRNPFASERSKGGSSAFGSSHAPRDTDEVSVLETLTSSANLVPLACLLLFACLLLQVLIYRLLFQLDYLFRCASVSVLECNLCIPIVSSVFHLLYFKSKGFSTISICKTTDNNVNYVHAYDRYIYYKCTRICTLIQFLLCLVTWRWPAA